MILTDKCPGCKKNQLELNGAEITCTSCGWLVRITCPLCGGDYEHRSDDLHCVACNTPTSVRRIHYLISNHLVVDHDHRCTVCHAPTIHRSTMNVSHRCFFFPKCAGQGDLFAAPIETLVFLDFETTGLEPGKDHIIEIGALKIDADGYDHVFSHLVNPQIPISNHIRQLTGISTEMVENEPTIDIRLPELMAFIGDATIVCHNTDFDIPWVVINAMRLGIPLADNSIICTLVWARKNQEPHCSLKALTKKYQIGHENAHRALADAAATRELYLIFDQAKKSPRPVAKLSSFVGQVTKSIQYTTDRHATLAKLSG